MDTRMFGQHKYSKNFQNVREEGLNLGGGQRFDLKWVPQIFGGILNHLMDHS